MKLKDLLNLIEQTQIKIESSKAMICGGVPRDKFMNKIENIKDIDITTGDKTVDYLSQEFFNILNKKYNAYRKIMNDGHSSIYIGNIKIDFSSNFIVNDIEKILHSMNIKNPSNLEKEIYSRDFTCNSLLMDLNLKKIYDLTKNGFKDINNKKIKTCLSPEITLKSNKNRVVRAIYLACKLDFTIDDSIINFVSKNPETVKISSFKTLNEKLNESFEKDPDKASYYISKMNLWNHIPITDIMSPYYRKILK